MRGLRWAVATTAALSLASVVVVGIVASPAGAKPSSPSSETCRRPVADPVTAAPVAGVASDFDVTSFDGTTIRAHWFPNATATPDDPRPTVLMGPGWGQPGDTNTNGTGILGSLGIRGLWDAGYNVLTWDPRGFGQSEGTVEVDSAKYEGRDVQTLLDWVATLPGVRLDRKGDPRSGMAGGSYGGGIQLITAAIDCRVDAIVPSTAWHSLGTSLYKAQIAKSGWAGVLAAVTRGRSVDPHITSASESSSATGRVSAEDAQWFVDRGPGALVERIHAPTLILQGTIDNLFTLDEGITNYRILRSNRVAAAMLWFCGGHGACLTKPGDEQRAPRATIAWLDRYVEQDASVKTGPRFDFVDQTGTRYTADDYPVRTKEPIVATGKGTLELTADGGSGPAVVPAGAGVVADIAAPITPAKAEHAVDVDVDLGTNPAILVGAPKLALQYRGTVPKGDGPTRVFAQLVDNATGVVLGNQVTPIRVTLDGKPHRVAVPLEAIAFGAQSGAHLTLQLVATTVAYARPRLGGSVTFEDVRLELPVASDITAP